MSSKDEGCMGVDDDKVYLTIDNEESAEEKKFIVGEKGYACSENEDDSFDSCEMSYLMLGEKRKDELPAGAGSAAMVVAALLLVTGVKGGQMPLPNVLKVFIVMEYVVEILFLQLIIFCYVIHSANSGSHPSCSSLLKAWLLTWPTLCFPLLITHHIHAFKKTPCTFYMLLTTAAILLLLTIAGTVLIATTSAHTCGPWYRQSRLVVIFQWTLVGVAIACERMGIIVSHCNKHQC